MLSPGRLPLPAAWAASGSARLDSALLPFVRVPRPVPASRGWAPRDWGSQRSHRGEGARMPRMCRNPPKPAVFSGEGGFLPASSLRPAGDGGHDEACTPLTSAPAAACSARSPHASAPLGLSLLPQGSRLRARLSLPSCSPVSRAFSGAALPPSCPPFFSLLAAFTPRHPPGTTVHLRVMASVMGTQMWSRVVSLGQGTPALPHPAATPAPCPQPWFASLHPRG